MLVSMGSISSSRMTMIIRVVFVLMIVLLQNRSSNSLNSSSSSMSKHPIRHLQQQTYHHMHQGSISHRLNTIDVLSFQHLTVNLVFFAYIPRSVNWKLLLDNYFADFIVTGLLTHVQQIIVCLSTQTNQDDEYKEEIVHFSTKESISDHDEAIERLFNATQYIDKTLEVYKDKIKYDLTLGNVFEFPGILRLWEEAQSLKNDSVAKDTIYLYLHSKGMIYHGELKKDNRKIYRRFFKTVVTPWKDILFQFATNSSIVKAGKDCDHQGVLNGNWYWIRGSELRSLRRPKRSDSRYYYEHWLMHKVSTSSHSHHSFPHNSVLRFDFVEFQEAHDPNWKDPTYHAYSSPSHSVCDGVMILSTFPT